MARVAVDHSYVDGNNPVTGHKIPSSVQHHDCMERLTECMGVARGKLERCLFCARVERDTSCISRRRTSDLCKTCCTGEILAAQHKVGGDQEE